jgi:serine phosphatase RsbU (regulator of sigma subunit)
MNGYGNAFGWAALTLKISDSLGYEGGQAISHMNLAILNDMQGNYQKAMEHYLTASRKLRDVNDEDNLAILYQNMGYFYSAQGNYRQAIDITKLAASLTTKLYGERGPAYNWGNLGYYYSETGEYDSALYYTLKAYEILKVEKDSAGLGEVFYNLGNIAYKADSNASKALNYALQAEEFYAVPPIELETLVECRYFIGSMYLETGDYANARKYLLLALQDAEQNNYRLTIKNIYQQLSAVEAAKQNWRDAYISHIRFFQIHDSLYNNRSGQKVEQLKTEYELETREARIELLKKDQIIQKDELERQMLLRNSFFGLFGLFAVVAFVLYRSNESKNRTNKLLLSQKKQIEEQHEAILRQNELLEEQKQSMLDQADYLEDANNQIVFQKETIEQKNRDITDSLTYARRMQHAMLPATKDLHKYLPDSFIWLQPRDIVSGDFYWFAKVNNKLFLAAIDCTGHGVPGAFMSLIGDVYLNQIVYQEKISSPCDILQKLHKYVRRALNQDTTSNQDGMEIALCVLDTDSKTVQYAGARNSLYFIQNNEVNKLAGDRVYVGGFLPPNFKGFTCKELALEEPASFYMCTDGVKDQFGGADDKKYGETRFKNLLLKLHKLPFEVQEVQAKAAIAEWMEGYEQIDDMLLMGWRV